MRKNKGFTLIELLVVIAVIGILAALVLANMGKARIKSKDAAIVVESRNIMTSVELETGATGDYTGVCDLFEVGGVLENYRTSIEAKGGIWEGCVGDQNSYAVSITLNAAQAYHPFINQAFAQYQQQYQQVSVVTVGAAEDKGVHSSEEVLMSEADVDALEEEARENNEDFVRPQYYCFGAVPPHVSGGNLVRGYLYQMPSSGCGSPVSSYEVAKVSYQGALQTIAGGGLETEWGGSQQTEIEGGGVYQWGGGGSVKPAGSVMTIF